MLLSCQCADDTDAVCTRSATVRLPGLPHSLVKLKHGGGVAMDGQDVQLPLLQGGLVLSHHLTCPSAVQAWWPLVLKIGGSGYASLPGRRVPWSRRRTSWRDAGKGRARSGRLRKEEAEEGSQRLSSLEWLCFCGRRTGVRVTLSGGLSRRG